MTPSLRRVTIPEAQPSGRRIALAIATLLVLLLVAAAVAYYFARGGELVDSRPQPSELIDTRALAKARLELCGPPGNGPHPIAFEMVYSDEMRPWIEAASEEFLNRCPNLQVKLRAAPDIDAADAIAGGALAPVLWVPTDDLALRYLHHRWKLRGDKPRFRIEDSISLVESPLVLLIWQDRWRLLSTLLREAGGADALWRHGMCALVPRNPDLTGLPIEAMVPGTWPDWYAPYAMPLLRDALAGDEPLPSFEEVTTWGRVKLGHAKPTRDSAGAAALYLMAHAYDHTVSEEGSDLGNWLRRCEAGLDEPPATTAALTKDMFDAGPSLYDGVITYEHLALPLLDRIDPYADALRKLVIWYPEPTLLAQHPAVFFDAPVEQLAAARRWLRFLLGTEMQQRAIEAGFRPVNPRVTIAGYNVEKNRFLQLRRYGIALHPRLVEAPPPDGSRITELLGLWGQATGRN